MFNLLSIIRKKQLWNFPGGIYLPETKNQSSNVPLRSVPISNKLIIPLKQHLGPTGELCVSPGDHVLRGQPLTVGRGQTLPVHAPTSGRVVAVIPHYIAHPSLLEGLCVILLPDGKDEWVILKSMVDFQNYSAVQLLSRVHDSGIAGLGGAGFPTAVKLSSGKYGIETLIINGAECESYITADDKLMREYADDIVTGMAILHHILKPKQLLVGIEDNKPEAITALRSALCERPIGEVRVIPTQYPSGSAKQLTKILTGKEIPAGLHSSVIGVMMLNVGTVYAIKRAVVNGEALTERIITLTGKALARPGNVWVRFGTLVRSLLAYAGFTSNTQSKVIVGGGMMGFTLPTLDVPVIKISNCLLAQSAQEQIPVEPEKSCIRCGRCADVCPVRLSPQQLYWFSQGQECDKAQQHRLFDCIECGACTYVCPSKIPLVNYFRQKKAKIRELDHSIQRAAMAKARYQARVTRRKREKQQQLLQSAIKSNDALTEATLYSENNTLKNVSLQTAVAAAIKRVKFRQQAIKNKVHSD